MVLEIEYTTRAVALQTPKFSAMAIAFVGAEAPILGIMVPGVLRWDEKVDPRSRMALS
jgi:hypothetical protein